MKNPVLVPELQELIAARDKINLRQFLETKHPAMVADLVSALNPGEAWQILLYAEPPVRTRIFSHLESGMQVEIIEILNREERVLLITDMAPDDRTDLFKRLPVENRETLLPALAQAEREDIRKLAAYEEGSAGAVMTSDYATLLPNLTVEQAVCRLRDIAPDRETIYYAYVVGEQRKLLGFVSLKNLILAPREALVENIMRRDFVFVRVGDDQEEAARKIQKYDLIAIPVINGCDALVGIITYDDAFDIMNQEHTEDMEKFMGIAGRHAAGVYLRTSSFSHFKSRAGWVAALAVLGLVSGYIVQKYEGLLLQFTILAAFMPMIADTGGNTGSQSATVVIRALALQECTPRDMLRILEKELRIGLMLGLMLGCLAYGRVFLFGGSSLSSDFPLRAIALAISVALGLQVVTATLIGAFLPLVAARLKLDPAVVASPALTTIVDITGLMIFFSVTKYFLGM